MTTHDFRCENFLLYCVHEFHCGTLNFHDKCGYKPHFCKYYLAIVQAYTRTPITINAWKSVLRVDPTEKMDNTIVQLWVFASALDTFPLPIKQKIFILFFQPSLIIGYVRLFADILLAILVFHYKSLFSRYFYVCMRRDSAALPLRYQKRSIISLWKKNKGAR